MKTTLLCLLLLLSKILPAQTIDNPSFKTRTGSRSNITRIERTPESTRLHIHAIFRPTGGSKKMGTAIWKTQQPERSFSLKTQKVSS